jgi:hypothetical protein
MSKTKVTCDDCQKEFIINELKTRWIQPDIQETYFVCKHCNKEYRVCLTDPEIRKLQEKVQDLNKPINKFKNSSERFIELQKLKNELKVKMEKLKESFKA